MGEYLCDLRVGKDFLDTKSMLYKRKIHKLDVIKIKISVLQKILWREWKDKPQTGGKYLQITYLIKKFYSHIKNSNFNNKKTIQFKKMDKQFKYWTKQDMQMEISTFKDAQHDLKMQIKTTRCHCLYPLGCLKLRQVTTPSMPQWGYGPTGMLHVYCWWECINGADRALPYNIAILLLRLFKSINNTSIQNLYMNVFAFLFVTSKNGKQPKYPLTIQLF